MEALLSTTGSNGSDGRGRCGHREVIVSEAPVKLHLDPGELSGKRGQVDLLVTWQGGVAAGVVYVPKYCLPVRPGRESQYFPAPLALSGRVVSSVQ